MRYSFDGVSRALGSRSNPMTFGDRNGGILFDRIEAV